MHGKCGWTLVAAAVVVMAAFTTMGNARSSAESGKMAVQMGNCPGAVNNTVASPSSYRESFSSDMVHDEVIVKFTGFYTSEARRGYIAAALSSLPVSYKVLERDNLMASYPSDFDVVQVSGSSSMASATVIETLKAHPLVKTTTPQRRVTRTLTSIFEDEEKEEDLGMDKVVTPCDHPPCINVKEGDQDDIGINLVTRGRRRLSFGSSFWTSMGRHKSRKLLRALPKQITALMQADILWEMGVSGEGVKVAIFDTGLSKTHPHFRKIRERSNWTNEKTLDDGLGHGTFVAGVIASSAECLGFAPDAELHIFRVFTNNQVFFINRNRYLYSVTHITVSNNERARKCYRKTLKGLESVIGRQ